MSAHSKAGDDSSEGTRGVLPPRRGPSRKQLQTSPEKEEENIITATAKKKKKKKAAQENAAPEMP